MAGRTRRAVTAELLALPTRSPDVVTSGIQQRLAGVSDRRARYVSTLVAVRAVDDPEPLVATGRWHGEILGAPQGAGGFGYDPLIHIPALGRTVATLSTGAKNQHSHRAIAASSMLALMREVWHLG